MEQDTNADPKLDNDLDSNNDGGDHQPTLEELQAKLLEAQGEAAKYRNIAKQAQRDRDELKKKKPEAQPGSEDYKQLWQETNDKLTKMQQRTKEAAINAALTAQLTKAGVSPDWMDAAARLADGSLVEWDEEAGVDNGSVIATVQKLKSAYPGFFNKKVNRTDAKNPSDGPSQEKTISRAEYDQLIATNPDAWLAKRKQGYKVV